MNQKLALYICLVGLAMLASLAVEAQKAPTPPANQPTSQQAQPPKQPEMGGQEEEQEDEEQEDDEEYAPDEEDYSEYDDDGEDMYEYEGEEEGEEEEESSEEKLSDLLEEHYGVKRDCEDLRNMVSEAQQSKQKADPEMQQAYEGCMQDLKEIENEMRALTREIFGE